MARAKELLDSSSGSHERRDAKGSHGAPRRRLAGCLVFLMLMAIVTAFAWKPVGVRWRQFRARELLGRRDEAAALQHLRAALRYDPDNEETLLLLARTHRRMGNLERVGRLLTRAEDLGGDRGRIERERRLVLAQCGELREVEGHLADMLIHAGEDGPDICEAFVQGYFANLRINEALQLLEVWQESYPHDPQPLFMRAYLFQGMNHPAEAIELYRKGLGMAPHKTTMRRRLAAVLLEAGRLDDAEAELLLCARRMPEDAETWYLLARCIHARGDVEEARRRLDKSLQLDPDHLDARRLKGQLDLERGKLDEALAELEQVVQRRPYDILAREALGRALRAMGRPEEAKAHFDFVTQAEESIARMNRLLRESLRKPHEAEVRYQIGTILFRYGPPDDAAKWMRAALQLDPEHVGAHRALAAYFRQRDEAAKAAFHLQQALLHEPPP
ncbi:MAG TPA: tetratricopeptide repeat protein [Planctomycetaceae bacterium]|nr:tetratricopeptide repeat protein [Planctomycetaceae bacterium]